MAANTYYLYIYMRAAMRLLQSNCCVRHIQSYHSLLRTIASACFSKQKGGAAVIVFKKNIHYICLASY